MTVFSGLISPCIEPSYRLSVISVIYHEPNGLTCKMDPTGDVFG